MLNWKTVYSFGLATSILFSGSQAFAETNESNQLEKSKIESLTKYQMPQDVKDVLLSNEKTKKNKNSENFSLLGESTDTSTNAPVEDPTNIPSENPTDIPSTIPIENGPSNATSAFPGATTSDTTYSSIFGSKGQNTIYAKMDSDGSWGELVYNKFSGWGYTGYFGTANPTSVTAKVRVKAYGLIPNISIAGSNWSLLSAARTLSSDSNSAGYKYARANYSNVKIQKLTGVNAIFINDSHIKLPSGLNDSWSEDTYVWF